MVRGFERKKYCKDDELAEKIWCRLHRFLWIERVDDHASVMPVDSSLDVHLKPVVWLEFLTSQPHSLGLRTRVPQTEKRACNSHWINYTSTNAIKVHLFLFLQTQCRSHNVQFCQFFCLSRIYESQRQLTSTNVIPGLTSRSSYIIPKETAKKSGPTFQRKRIKWRFRRIAAASFLDNA